MITAATVCLAMNIYHEARGEVLAGQLAVAQTVMNRVASPKYPDDICSVVKQGHYWEGHPIRNRCAFSWWCDGRSDTPSDNDAWMQALSLAYKVEGKFIVDVSEGATHYHATHVNPYWANHYTVIGTLGNHIFYK